jgi:thymidylate synthase
MQYLLEELQKKEPSGTAQISMWDKLLDQKNKISPCVQIIWCRIKNNQLEMHVHAYSSDTYNKLLMNMQEFISLQAYIAKTLKIKIGKYFHIIYSCHIHCRDQEKVNLCLTI